jgi:hypothetical protein
MEVILLVFAALSVALLFVHLVDHFGDRSALSLAIRTDPRLPCRGPRLRRPPNGLIERRSEWRDHRAAIPIAPRAPRTLQSIRARLKYADPRSNSKARIPHVNKMRGRINSERVGSEVEAYGVDHMIPVR